MPKLGTRARTILIAGGATAVLAAPFAGAAGEGRPVDGGARNPSENQSRNYTRETEIIANVNTYGTRQSNKSNNGGGAVYGCRSRAGGTPRNNEPCLRATNLADGLAFEFNSNNGTSAGAITVGNGGDERRPFTTNATGVATGLNADRIDGVEGEQIARAGDFLFARVNAQGAVVASRGGTVSAATSGEDDYVVTFPRDVSRCSFTVTEDDGEADALWAATSGGTSGPAANTVNVDQTTVGGPPSTRQPFHLQVMC